MFDDEREQTGCKDTLDGSSFESTAGRQTDRQIGRLLTVERRPQLEIED